MKLNLNRLPQRDREQVEALLEHQEAARAHHHSRARIRYYEERLDTTIEEHDAAVERRIDARAGLLDALHEG